MRELLRRQPQGKTRTRGKQAKYRVRVAQTTRQGACRGHRKGPFGRPCSDHQEEIRPDSIVYTDAFSRYDVLDVSEFHHIWINPSTQFADGGNPINGIENFWSQAKRHLRRSNGIPRQHFPLFIKGREWRFNYRPISRMYSTLLRWWFR